MVKLYEGGERNDAVFDIVIANTRMPAVTRGDMQAQKSSMEVGAERVVEVFERYGVDTVEQAVADDFDAGERLVREEIRDLPNGTYTAEDCLDDDGITDDPVHVEVEVTIREESVELDYTGTDPETEGPINAPYAASVSDIRAFFQAITLPTRTPTRGSSGRSRSPSRRGRC